MSYQAGWYADPTGRFEHRYYDGTAWTEHVARGGTRAVDAFDQPAPGSPPPPPPSQPQSPSVAPTKRGVKVTPGEIVVMAAGGVALIASFLPFWRFSAEGETESVTAWGPGLFPVASLIAVFALAAGALVALDKFANVNINFLGFRVLQLVLALGAASVLLALGYLILDNGAIVGGELTLDDLETFINIEIDASRGIGYYLLLLGSIGSVVGGVVMANERKSAAPGSA